MTTPGQVAGATQEAAGQTAATARDEAARVGGTAKEQAVQVTGTAKEQAVEVTSTAKEQAGNVAAEAVSQVRDLLDQTRAQVSEQAGGAQKKLGESLKTLTDELRSMGDGSGSGTGPAAELARTLADRGSAIADYLSSKEPGDLVQEVRSFAARRPGGFLLGALVAGVAAGRLVRGATADSGPGSAAAPARPAALPSVPATTGTPYDREPLVVTDRRTSIDPVLDPVVDPLLDPVYPSAGYPDGDPGEVSQPARTGAYGSGREL